MRVRDLQSFRTSVFIAEAVPVPRGTDLMLNLIGGRAR